MINIDYFSNSVVPVKWYVINHDLITLQKLCLVLSHAEIISTQLTVPYALITLK